uniref:Uncharacterized protein n=1 Tax=Candidatus Kentrum sp. LPFa TaxID=2126335 RepID=A0A450X457_9GAMM|nr:MAG: hypothetical protein BECKLPF1236A_GA0070988_100159 [Candidatus Kentron sp. LPFa]VFK24076.1 MAG: hypothetical protein BECKLPF1236C_GA0070990_1001011 [Candidatus Kentron sp. LPFa]
MRQRRGEERKNVHKKQQTDGGGVPTRAAGPLLLVVAPWNHGNGPWNLTMERWRHGMEPLPRHEASLPRHGKSSLPGGGVISPPRGETAPRRWAAAPLWEKTDPRRGAVAHNAAPRYTFLPAEDGDLIRKRPKMEIDKTKEEVGWLKVVFALLVVTDVSLIGWTAQNLHKASVSFIFLAIFVIALVTWAIIETNRRAYRKIKKLGDL